MSASEIISFTQMAIAAPVLAAIQDVGYEQPSPIQAASIPHLLRGDDLIGMAQTGTGKTAAFALPLLSRINTDNKLPQVLVLTPTRELAIQVAEAFQRYAAKLSGFHVLPVYGGQEYGTQLRRLKRGPQVIVGTPGRVMDHLRRGSLKLSGLISLVLDEADEMLRMGFIEDVEWILEHTPDARQTALFSATLPREIRNVAKKYLNQPREVRIPAKTSSGDNIQQSYWMVSGTHKLDALTRILEVENFDAMLVFVRTKTATVELAEKLEARGYPASALHGDMNQQLRERTIARLRNNKLDILVATDVAARGIDVPRITHVLNFDIPHDSGAYIHRIGRTGRAGRSGKAILFVAPREKRLLHTIEKATRQALTRMELPSGETITARRVDQFKQTLENTLARQDLSFFDAMLAEFSHSHDVAAEDIASALAYLCQQQHPLQVKFKKINGKKVRGHDQRDTGKPGHTRKHPGENRHRDTANRLRYRLKVGRRHGVHSSDIVAIIADEAGLDSRYIGDIKLYDTFSTVDLPAGMPKEIFRELKKVYIRDQKLNISVDSTGNHDKSKTRRKSAVKNRNKKLPAKTHARRRPAGRPRQKDQVLSPSAAAGK